MLNYTKRSLENYTDMINRLYPSKQGFEKCRTRTVTFQVTDACNLACSYCYQINKSHRKMKFEDAKKLIDMILNEDERLSEYLTLESCPALIIEFIGGEPFLEIELIHQIYDYFLSKTIEMRHPWAIFHMVSISTNGILYFEPRVQEFLSKAQNNLSLSITLDGNKELHDSCRRFPNGDPSYDIVIKAVEDWSQRTLSAMSKITIAPENITHLYEAFVHMVKLGYIDINANTVYEKGWTIDHAKIFYNELIKMADYLLENDTLNNIYCSLFEEHYFCPMTEIDNDNWCGGTGDMLAMDPDGFLFPCIRYMESSLGKEVEPYCIGHVNSGIAQTEKEIKRVKCLNCITRRSQSTDECFNCPIAKGCGWCSGYNYQTLGTPDARCTYICEMHKARALANVYFWNQFYIRNNINKRMPMFCPKEWALKIISEDEYNKLCNLIVL